MEYRKLGNSGLKVSAVSLGAWLTYGSTTVEEDTAMQCIRRAIESGINFIDVADIYSMGRGEELTEIRTEIAALCPEHSNVFPKEKEPGSYAKYAKVLDLVEQVTTIDYNQPHFRQADATLRQILLHKSPKNITLCTALRDNKERLKAALENEDPATQAFKKLGSSTSRNAMALALSKIITKDRVQSEKEGDMSNQFIIFDRNDIAFAALKKEISSFASGAEIVVFYGAAHLDDIERSLTGLGYKLDSTEWLSAFSL